MHLQIEMLKLDLLMLYTFSQHKCSLVPCMALPAKESLGTRLA